MRIPSDIQVPVQPTRSGVLESLGLRVGQAIEARVVGQTPNGATQVRVGNRTISLELPVKPQLGQVLQMLVEGTGAKPELVLTGQGNTAGRPPPPATLTNITVARPAADTVTLSSGAATSAQAEAPPSGAAAAPRNAPGYPAYTASRATGIPGQNAQGPQASIPVPTAVQSALNLQPGQFVSGQVTGTAPNGQSQLAIGQQTITAGIPGRPPPGTVLEFRADFSGGQPRLVLTGRHQPQRPAAATPAPPGTAAPSSAPANHAAQALPAGPVTAASVQQAVAQTTASAVARQDSVGTLIASLTGLQGRAGELPPDVSRAAGHLLSSRLDLGRGEVTAEALRQAVSRSGVFLEAMLAGGARPSAETGDMKAILFLMRNALGKWLQGDEPQAGNADRRPAPPMRGASPRAPAQMQQPLPDGLAAREAGRHLLSQTDSALSRLKLFQLSSQPDGAQRAHQTAAQRHDWHFEIPFALGDTTSMAQFRITRDGADGGETAERGWHVEFAVNFAELGEVGAKVSFRSRRTGVMLWAEDEKTAGVLEEMLPELVSSLESRGLQPGSVHVRHGAPENAAPPSGGFVDSVS